jgi:hypothetical protein
VIELTMAILLPFNKVFPNGVAWVPCGVTWLRRVEEFHKGSEVWRGIVSVKDNKTKRRGMKVRMDHRYGDAEGN